METDNKKKFKLFAKFPQTFKKGKQKTVYQLEPDGSLEIEGVASTSNQDLEMDIVLPSAIESMKEQATALNLHIDHDYGFEGAVGAITNIVETDENTLQIKARIRPKYATDIQEMLDTGINIGMSIGGEVIDYNDNLTDGGWEINDIDLYEISLTTMPANWDTFGTVMTTKGITKSTCLTGACYQIMKNLKKDEENNMPKTQKDFVNPNMEETGEVAQVDLINEVAPQIEEQVKDEIKQEIMPGIVEQVESDIIGEIKSEIVQELRQEFSEPQEPELEEPTGEGMEEEEIDKSCEDDEEDKNKELEVGEETMEKSDAEADLEKDIETPNDEMQIDDVEMEKAEGNPQDSKLDQILSRLDALEQKIDAAEKEDMEEDAMEDSTSKAMPEEDKQPPAPTEEEDDKDKKSYDLKQISDEITKSIEPQLYKSVESKLLADLTKNREPKSKSKSLKTKGKTEKSNSNRMSIREISKQYVPEDI